MRKQEKFHKKEFVKIVAFVIISLLSGCNNRKFIDPINRFQKAASIVISSTSIYVNELNKTERERYIQDRLGKREQIILKDLDEVQVFSKDGLEARLFALNQLESYSNLLLKMANSDGPEKIKAGAEELGAEMSKLSSTVNKLTGSGDSDFKSAVGPVSIIVSEIAGLVTQKKIKDALNKAVKEGSSPINKLLSVIRSDVTLAYQRKRSALSDLRVNLIDDYNREMKKGQNADSEKLKFLAERIGVHENRWEIFASSNPEDGIESMIKAHNALVNYAESNYKITDFATLIEALEAFSTRAENLGKAVKALHEID